MAQSAVHIIVGDDEFLIERARQSIQRQAQQTAAADMATGAGMEVRTLRASEVSEAELIDATSPSLFADNRLIVVTDAERTGSAIAHTLLSAARSLGPGMTLVVIYTVTAKTWKAKKKPPELVAGLKKLGQLHEAFSLYPNELEGWLRAEFASYGVRLDPDIIHAILRGVGSNLRELAAAASQLVADSGGEITRQTVADYYSGVAEVANWDIADAAVAGDVDAAVATCRRALQLGASPVAIAAALANKVGTMARLYSHRGDPQQLAGVLKMNPYALKMSQPIARQWSPGAITEAVIVMDQLDYDVKGQSGIDADFAVEAAVRKIAELARR